MPIRCRPTLDYPAKFSPPTDSEGARGCQVQVDPRDPQAQPELWVLQELLVSPAQPELWVLQELLVSQAQLELLVSQAQRELWVLPELLVSLAQLEL